MNLPDFGAHMDTLRQPESEIDRIAAGTGIDMEHFFAELQKAGNDLLAKRRELAALRAERVRLEARYGSTGQSMSHWDHQRKSLLAELDQTYRADMQLAEEEYLKLDKEEQKTVAKPQKVTEGSADAYTHAHPRYKQFLEESLAERTEYVGYRAKVDALYAEIEHLQGVREYLVQRIRLNEEAVRHARTMANLGG